MGLQSQPAHHSDSRFQPGSDPDHTLIMYHDSLSCCHRNSLLRGVESSRIPWILPWVTERPQKAMRDDPHLLQSLLRREGRALRFASKRLRGDRCGSRLFCFGGFGGSSKRLFWLQICWFSSVAAEEQERKILIHVQPAGSPTAD